MKPRPLRKGDVCPDGVQMSVDWGSFVIGSSVFVPCIDTERCKEQVLQIAKENKFEIETRRRIEDGRWGLRIWRTL